jgi:hypothetical protein
MRIKSKRIVSLLIVCSVQLCLLCSLASAQQQPAGAEVKRNEQTGWGVSTFVRYSRQFDTDVDSGGGYRADRATASASLRYAFEQRRTISLAVGYNFDGYDFYGSTGLAGLRPWKNIHSVRFGVPIRWGLDDRWTLFGVPTIRSTGEQGASFSDSLNGGGFVGASYYLDENLTIGPGLGILTQIEDDTTVFPILLIDWRITERLSFGTGRGEGATLGPGLYFSWQPNTQWTFSFGGRYERLRFRLDDSGVAPRGVGEDRAFPLVGGATYNISPRAQLTVSGGILFGGRLTLEDQNGNTIDEQDYDPTPFLGASLRCRF